MSTSKQHWALFLEILAEMSPGQLAEALKPIDFDLQMRRRPLDFSLEPKPLSLDRFYQPRIKNPYSGLARPRATPPASEDSHPTQH